MILCTTIYLPEQDNLIEITGTKADFEDQPDLHLWSNGYHDCKDKHSINSYISDWMFKPMYSDDDFCTSSISLIPEENDLWDNVFHHGYLSCCKRETEKEAKSECKRMILEKIQSEIEFYQEKVKEKRKAFLGLK